MEHQGPKRLYLIVLVVVYSEWKHRFDVALKYVTRAIDMDLNFTSGSGIHGIQDISSAEQYVLRAKLYWTLGLIDAGIKDMNMAMSIAPYHIEVRRFNDAMQFKSAELYRIAIDHMAHQDFARAIVLLSAAVRIAPDDIKLLVTRASASRQVGACDAALKDLKKASAAYYEAIQPANSLLRAAGNISSTIYEPYLLRHPEKFL